MAIQRVKCRKCGLNTAVCTHWENGGRLSFNDNFRHVCQNPKCGHTEESLDNNGGELGYEDLPCCPMCGSTHSCTSIQSNS